MASVSPELFLKVRDGQVESRPIKGTRPRSNDPTRDTQLACELQTSPKERAELVGGGQQLGGRGGQQGGEDTKGTPTGEMFEGKPVFIDAQGNRFVRD